MFGYCTVNAVNPMDSTIIRMPNDTVLDRITDISSRIKAQTIKDTTTGFSAPIKIETSALMKMASKHFATQDDRPRDRKGLLVVPLNYEPFLSYINFVDTIIQSPALLPVVFEGKILSNDFDFRQKQQQPLSMSNSYLINKDSIIGTDIYERKRLKKEFHLIDIDSTFHTDLIQVKNIESTRKSYYVANPEKVKSNALAFSDSPIVKKEIGKQSPFKELITAGDAITISAPQLETFKVKQKYWKRWGEHKLNISQKAYSDNWNPKTNNNFQIENYHKFSTQYKKNKIEFNHWIEWRLNVQSVSIPKEDKEKNPDYNSLLIGDDWIRTYNKLGLESFIKKWSYIVSLDMKTPIFNKYPQNDKKKRLSGLFSPLDLTFGIGAGYTLNKKSKHVKDRNLKLTVDATPLSFDLKHVGSHKVYKNNNHGIKYEPGSKKEGQPRYTKTEFGSTLNATLDYKLNGYTSLFSRTKYFTNYSRVYLEWENTLNFKLNKYLSTSLYMYMKYDDNVGIEKKDKDWKYFSYSEVLGFGLSYTW